MDCLHYNAIMSKVFMQSYGVQLNISLLPLVSASPSRWTVQLSPGLSAYTGVTFVTGDGIDGMPRYLHSANTVWDSGIRLTYNFKKGGKQ